MRQDLKEMSKRRRLIAARLEGYRAEFATEEQSVARGGEASRLLQLRDLIAHDQQSLAAIDQEIATLQAATVLTAALDRVATLADEAKATKGDYDRSLIDLESRWVPEVAALADLEQRMANQQSEALDAIRSAYGIDLHNADSPAARAIVATLEAALRERGVDLSALFQRFPNSARGFVLEQPYRLPMLTPTGHLVLGAVELEHVRRTESLRAEQERCEAAEREAVPAMEGAA